MPEASIGEYGGAFVWEQEVRIAAGDPLVSLPSVDPVNSEQRNQGLFCAPVPPPLDSSHQS